MSAKSLAFVIADDPAYLSWLQAALGESVSFTLAQPEDEGRLRHLDVAATLRRTFKISQLLDCLAGLGDRQGAAAAEPVSVAS